MKKIGIIPLYDSKKESYWMLPGYMDALTEMGALAVMLPMTDNIEILNKIADEYDGFLFTGGHDVSPSVYGEEASPWCGECCNMRDKMEGILLNMVIERDKPVLGICRGIQLINALMGGSLYQDLPRERPSRVNHRQRPPYNIPVHSVKIYKDNLLYNILNKEELNVNSYHHQAVKELALSLKAVAISEDGLVEAVTMENKKFVLAIQWHPEFSYKTDEDSRKIFRAFLEA